MVASKDVEFIVIDTDTIIWISGYNGDLHIGGEKETAGGDVECVDGGVLESELGFCGTEDEPDDEYGQ